MYNAPMPNTPLWIQHSADLPPALAAATTWFLDTEFMRERTFWANLALVQVAAGDELVLFDAPRESSLENFGKLLADKRLVLHASSEDLEVLAHATGVAPRQVEDTQLAAALVGLPLQLSYQKLVETACGVLLPKDATRSDWLQRPLSPAQLAYAADDVRYLEAAHDWLQAQLVAKGRLSWWQEENGRLLRQVLSTTAPDQLWKQVKGAGSLSGMEVTRLQQLAAWRDAEARSHNVPRSFIVKDDLLLQLARRAPETLAQVGNLGLAPGLVRRQGDVLLDLLANARNLPMPAPLPGMLEGKQKQAFGQMKQVVAEVAAELGLETEVLARRRWLEALVRQPDVLPEPLTGWRQELLARRLLAVC